MPDVTTAGSATRRAREFLTAIRNTPDLDYDARRWVNTAMRWAWLAGYLAARTDIDRGIPPSKNPFSSRSIEEEHVPEPTDA
jgi:hypothetical protein